jgi:hypothetical protein
LPIRETISVQGRFIRKICLSRIEYYCCFTEDRGRSTPFKPDAAIPSLNDNRDQLPRTSLHDIETVVIQGFFTCDPSQDRIVYSCSFMEERDPSTFFKHVPEAESDFRNDAGDTECNESRSTAKALTRNSVRSMLYSPQEDELRVSLRAQGLSWSNIARRFPGQTEGSLQVRYCTKLNPQKFGSRRRKPGRARSITSSVRSVVDPDRESRSAECAAPSQRYGPSRSRRAVDRYSPG